ncbi:hypothetical protein PBI_SPORTO_74 [Arthrobacter phage Sporto]|nr:hypothetical protein PBI_SPORTO_74 [Arthrobacter phage Sporto]
MFYQVKGFPEYEISQYKVVRRISTKEPAEVVYMGGNFIKLVNSEGGYAYVPVSDLFDLLEAAKNG